jgi:hypothetical protein
MPMICLSSYYLYMMLQDCLQPVGVPTCIPFASLRINMLSTSTSIGMLAYKAGLVEALRLRYRERKQLRMECTSLLAELQRAANQSSAAPVVPPHPAGDSISLSDAAADAGSGAANSQPSARAPAIPPPAEQGPDFILDRNTPSSTGGASGGTSASGSAASGAPSASALAGVSGSASGTVGALRGECPACKKNVYTTDEGRVKEGDAYYHAGCVKGTCSKCSKNVYGDQARGRESDGYYHLECPP